MGVADQVSPNVLANVLEPYSTAGSSVGLTGIICYLSPNEVRWKLLGDRCPETVSAVRYPCSRMRGHRGCHI